MRPIPSWNRPADVSGSTPFTTSRMSSFFAPTIAAVLEASWPCGALRLGVPSAFVVPMEVSADRMAGALDRPIAHQGTDG